METVSWNEERHQETLISKHKIPKGPFYTAEGFEKNQEKGQYILALCKKETNKN